jgi:hypothetical protein
MSEDKLKEIADIVEKPFNVFKELNCINVNDKTEKKQNLTYLSWAWAWEVVKEKFPLASYAIDMYDGKPYLYDENLGYMVSTKVNIAGQELGMHLPVMDGANKAMKSTEYTYQTRSGKKTVQQATMFDINKTIMRCLVKNLAMFGLGLYIYAGEDLPETEKLDYGKIVRELNAEYEKIKNPDDKIKKFMSEANTKTAEQLAKGLERLKEINK